MSNLKLNIWWKEALLFGSVQVLGLLTAQRSLQSFSNSLKVGVDFSWRDALVSGSFLALFIWATIRPTVIGRWFIRIFFWLMIWSGSFLVFSAFLPPLWAFLAPLALLIIGIKLKRVILHNLAVILAAAGLGGLLGLSISPLWAVAALAVFSFYDILAVYFSRHMVVMAKNMIEAGAVFGLIIPSRWEDFKEKITVARPGERFMVLGSGDLVWPLILSASLVRVSLWQAWTVAVFSLFGLILTHILFFRQSKRRPMAALPPIAMMSTIGYALALFFSYFV